ncbi:MAG: SpoVA/SpoVAEb family sporulation membrane protein [Thermaerobacter sp.]|nr:SpoVA/SpoVAEb family sporulation membrane protein [Thermaerobacter sp.]
MEKKEYQKRARQVEPPRPVARNAFWAFLIGGAICLVGQGVQTALQGVGYSEETVKAPTAVIMVFLGALFTATGLYDRLTVLGGMGASLPITGFSNAVVAPAIEFRNEGAVMGTGARIFQVAGPVIAYGLFAAFIVGIVRFALRGVLS